MNTNFILELEEILLRFEEVRDLLSMLSDCALEGANSLDNYGSGIALIATLANNNTNKLQALFDKVHPTAKKGA